MKILKNFISFWYDFIVGDDWRIAALVIVGLAATSFLADHTSLQAWWLLPSLVVIGVTISLGRAAKPKK